MSPEDLVGVEMVKASQVGTLVLGLGVLAGCSEPDHEFEVGTQSQSVDWGSPDEEGEIVLSAEENRVRMLENRANRHGWTYAEAEMDQEATEAVGDAATRLETARPGTLVGSVVPDSPGDHPLLYIKGPADEQVKQIVAEAGVPIRIIDEQPYSLMELQERKNKVHVAIRDAGYQASSWVDFRQPDEIRVKVGRVPGEDLAELDTLVALVPKELRSITSIEVVDREVVRREGAWGGMRARDGSSHVCTTGWSMEWQDVVWPYPWIPLAVTTAAHCSSGIDNILHTSTAHDSDLLSQYDGDWGDVELRLVDATPLPRFYISNATSVTVTAVEPFTGFSIGEEVCLYSRVQGGHDCADIQTLFAACDEALFQIQMDEDISEPGDSGGSWYQDNTAFGGHVGDCENLDDNSDFTPADFFDEIFGSRFRVYVD